MGEFYFMPLQLYLYSHILLKTPILPHYFKKLKKAIFLLKETKKDNTTIKKTPMILFKTQPFLHTNKFFEKYL